MSLNLNQIIVSPIKTAAYRASGPGMGNLGWSRFSCPVQLRLPDGSFWKLPSDPVIAVTCKNIVCRRYVSKSQMRGSVKERWSQDDCEINISGLFMADSPEELSEWVRTLRRAIEVKEAVAVICDMLQQYYDVTRIVVESCSFPFTQGECNQRFDIKAFSDDGYTLLEEL